jgi:hypothetical protein
LLLLLAPAILFGVRLELLLPRVFKLAEDLLLGEEESDL